MKKLLTKVSVLLLSSLLIVGCGESATENPDTKKIVYAPMWAQEEAQGQVIAEAAEAFTAETGIEVEILWTTARDNKNTVGPSIDAGETIDLFDGDMRYVATDGDWNQYALDLTTLYENSDVYGNLNEALINIAKNQDGGKLTTIPYQPAMFTVMVNKTAWEAAGLTSYPETWEDFIIACQALVDAGYIPLTTDDAYMPATFGVLMTRVAGVETAYEVAGGDVTNPAVFQTAQVIEDLAKLGYIDPAAEGNAYPAGQQDLASGKVAMYINGTWLPNEVRNQVHDGYTWGAFSLPAITENGASTESNVITAQGFVINKDTAYPEETFQFIQYLTSGEWDQKLADNTFGVPASNDATWPVELTDAKAVLDNSTVTFEWGARMENNADLAAAIKTLMPQLIAQKIDAQTFADELAKVTVN